MDILVTGGAGYIGSHMVLALLEAGHSVVVVDDLSSGVRSAVSPSAKFVEGNIGDTKLIGAILRQHKVKAVFHFAGSIKVGESIEQPGKYYQNNTMNSLSLIETARACGVKYFIFSSSAAVYGTPAAMPVLEDAPTGPESPYGTSKLMVEQILRDVCRVSNMLYIALRYFNVVGVDPLGRAGYVVDINATHLLRSALLVALGKKEYLEVFGTDYPTPDGTAVRDYIHVSDLVSAHMIALRHLVRDRAPRVLNVGYGNGYSVLQIAHAVEKVTGAHVQLRYVGRRSGDAAQVIANASRIRNLGWQPHHDSLSTIIAQEYEWVRSRL